MSDADRVTELEERLQKILAFLHDASQVQEGHVFEDGTINRNITYTKPLLDIIGDIVECPDCKEWDRRRKAKEDEEDDGIDWAEIARRDIEIKEEMELDRRLRERP